MDSDEKMEMAIECSRLYQTFLANMPATDGKGKFNLEDFAPKAAILLSRFILDKTDKADKETVFFNGMLYGIMLAELGEGKYILREKSGKPPSYSTKDVESVTIEFPDSSGIISRKK